MVQGVQVEDGFLVNTNPATGEVIGKVEITTPEEVDATVLRSKIAQVTWAAMPLDERMALLREAIAQLKGSEAELTNLITQEMGKVVSEAGEEAGECTGQDERLDLIQKANAPQEIEGAVIVQCPHGVVLICSPWNFPAAEILMLALPALAAGNTVILKPSEVSPSTGAKVVETLRNVLPSSVVQVCQGDGDVGKRLVSHADIAMVAMTGSSATGRRIMEACSGSLKRLVLELGGKDPMVIFADADLDKAAEDAVTWSLYNAGQVCCSIERVYIENSVKADFEARVQAKASAWVAGDGTDPASKLGPMVSDMQKQNVKMHVEDAMANGATKLCEGEVRGKASGNFFPATVLTDLKQDMKIMQEETFGPVVAIAGFDGSESEALRLANDTEYGLSACVYSGDNEKARRVAMGIKAGQVGVNSYPMATAPVACPWVGHKGSGFGFHSGADGYRQFSVPKSIIVPT